LLSEKLRNSQQLTEERLRNADDRIASFEKEITASRSQAMFLKQQMDSASRALRANQEELQRLSAKGDATSTSGLASPATAAGRSPKGAGAVAGGKTKR
jgi:chromosome segregation ATPase